MTLYPLVAAIAAGGVGGDAGLPLTSQGHLPGWTPARGPWAGDATHIEGAPIQDEHALPEDRTAAKARQRQQLIAVCVVVFLVALVIGLWSGGIMFGD